MRAKTIKPWQWMLHGGGLLALRLGCVAQQCRHGLGAGVGGHGRGGGWRGLRGCETAFALYL